MEAFVVSVFLFLAAYALVMAGCCFAAIVGDLLSDCWNPSSSEMAGRPPVLGAPRDKGEERGVAPTIEGTASDILLAAEVGSGD